MPSGNRGDDYRSYASGTYDPRSNGHRTHSYDQGSSHGNPNSGLVPTYADTTSRRRSMNIEDMLNHSDEDTRRYQQPQFRRSEAGRTVFRNPRTVPGSLQGNRAPRSGPQSHGANASARSRGGSHPPPTQGRGSASPDVPSRTRAARPAYSNEEKHFIWYLRIDCGYSWPAIAEAFNAHFSHGGEGRREIPGLQCRFYRVTEANGLPNVREMQRTRDTVQRCAMRAITGYTREKWSWLDGRYPASNAV